MTYLISFRIETFSFMPTRHKIGRKKMRAKAASAELRAKSIRRKKKAKRMASLEEKAA